MSDRVQTEVSSPKKLWDCWSRFPPRDGMEFDHAPSPPARDRQQQNDGSSSRRLDRRQSTSAVHDGEELISRLVSAVQTRQASRIEKVVARMEAVGGVALRRCAGHMAAARRLLALLGLLDKLDLLVQKIEFDHHSRFTAMQHGHILVTLRKAPGASFGIVFAKSRLVDPSTGMEFKSLNCKRMKYQGNPYNVRGCVNGDVLLEVNGQPVTTSRELNDVIGDSNAVVLKINRSVPRAMGLQDLETTLNQLVTVVDEIDTLPVPSPGAADNMTDNEVALLQYGRDVVLRTKKHLAVLVLLQNALGELNKVGRQLTATERQRILSDVPDLWAAACKLRLDKQNYPSNNEIAQLISKAREEVERSFVPRSPPPPLSRRASAYARSRRGIDGATSDAEPDIPLSPRVIEATKASVQRRLQQQKFLNTPTETIEFERRQRRGTTHELSPEPVARNAEQRAVESALTLQDWVGLVEHAEDGTGEKSEQWADVHFKVVSWTFDERVDDLIAGLKLIGRECKLDPSGSDVEGVVSKPLDISGTLLLRTRQIVLRRHFPGKGDSDYTQVFHGTLLGLESKVPRVIAETVRGEAVRLELTRANVVTYSPPGSFSTGARTPSGGNTKSNSHDDSASFDNFHQVVESDDGDNSETEEQFMAKAMKKIQKMVEVEQSQQQPVAHSLPKNKPSAATALVATVGRIGRELASEAMTSSPRTRLNSLGDNGLVDHVRGRGNSDGWDVAPSSDDGRDSFSDFEGQEDEGDDAVDIGVAPAERRKLVRNASNRLLLSPRSQEKRRSRLIAQLGPSRASQNQDEHIAVGARGGKKTRSNGLTGTGTREQKYAFSLLLEGCTGARFSWTKFHGLKTPEEAGLMRGSVANFLAWQQKGLRTSLTHVAGSSKLAAIKMYKYIRAFCGDKKLRPKKEYREIVCALVNRCVKWGGNYFVFSHG